MCLLETKLQRKFFLFFFYSEAHCKVLGRLGAVHLGMDGQLGFCTRENPPPYVCRTRMRAKKGLSRCALRLKREWIYYSYSTYKIGSKTQWKHLVQTRKFNICLPSAWRALWWWFSQFFAIKGSIKTAPLWLHSSYPGQIKRPIEKLRLINFPFVSLSYLSVNHVSQTFIFTCFPPNISSVFLRKLY